jgi:outer membrane protein assembly factor BamB|tara:strand:+ start:837 stop:2162 length:1326 start_codon:yes stop_codon:yes gene_type:complete
MKLFYALIILTLLQNCSFDNKTGIWKNDNIITKKENDSFKEFKTLSSEQEFFDKIIPIKKNLNLEIPNQINVIEWKDIFYNRSNNFENFKYNNSNQIIFKSKKLSKYKINESLLFINNNLIASDQNGNIIIYSIGQKNNLFKFNFYKKKFKKYKKRLNLIVENDIIYISDNLGYLYAYNFKNNKIIWAKNYKIPFKSNLKISENKLFAANINNDFFILEKNTGNILKKFPTEETIVQNMFVNNLTQSKDSILFLNTYGSLYSISNDKMNINWFLNLNPSLDVNPSNLFYSNQIINNDELIVVTANKFTYVVDVKTGSTIYKLNFTSTLKPLIIGHYLFLISKNNLLISFDLKNGKIAYSYDINQEISKFLDTKQKKAKFKNLIIADDHLLILLKNSFVLKFNLNGTLKDIYKLPSKINSNPMFVDGSILYLDFNKKLSVVN